MRNTPTPKDLAGWLTLFSDSEMPILRQTTRRLDEARQHIDRVSARDITDIVLQDPLLAIRVLAYIQAFGSKHLRSDITNIASAVMMLGVEPFFRKFETPLTIEALLGRQPQALLGMLQVVLRTQRAARYAHDWAFARHDMNVEEVALAALLHDLAEVLLWCFAPDLALAIRARLQADRTLRSASIQEEVLGFPLADLQLALCHAWHLPGLLTTLMNDGNARLPRVQNVTLAVNLARHSVDGWTDAAIPDDLAAIQNLLNISRETLLARLQLPTELLPALVRIDTLARTGSAPDNPGQ
jgi:HD-like signal output (HDOD) protein